MFRIFLFWGVQEPEKPKKRRPGDEGHRRCRQERKQTLKAGQCHIRCFIEGCSHPGFAVYNKAISVLPRCVNESFVNYCTDWNKATIYENCEQFGYSDNKAKILRQVKTFQHALKKHLQERHPDSKPRCCFS